MSPAEQFPGLDAKWRVYRTPDFELFSRASEGGSRNLLRNLEVMRAVFFQFLELSPRDPTEVSIYFFKSGSHFQAYASPDYHLGKDYYLIGEYRKFPDRDVITLSPEEGLEASRWIVYSNLARSLLLTTGGRGPSWLRQGLGMFFGTFDCSGDRVLLGEPDALRRRLVSENPTMDVEQLFVVEEGLSAVPAQDATNLFHAKSWVLLHYWYCGQTEVPLTAVNRFVRFVLDPRHADDPAQVRAAFQDAFKMDYAEMNRRVARYMRKGRFTAKRLPFPTVAAADTYPVRALDPTEMRERLAELLLRTRRDPAAKFVLLDAMHGPRAARAAEALGNEAAGDRDDRLAQDYWMRAIDAGTTNSAVLSLVARMEFARWFANFDYYFRLSANKTAELRELLARCIAQAPDHLEYYEMLAWIESAAPEPFIPNVNLVQVKFPSLSNPARTLVPLALIRARVGDRVAAKNLLAEIDRASPGKDIAEVVKSIQLIMEREDDLASPAADRPQDAPR
ncbi:MAG: hypothetical protein HYV95_08060 [Opitutae bacterium]|nr:hypothetical protein [Opitutae bacterium]